MNKRQRGRNRNNNRNRQPNNNPNRSLDSNGPDIKVRGSASTIYEKYISLARDARSGGSRVKAENYFQHAEHYLRIVQEQQIKAQEHAEKQAKIQEARQEEMRKNKERQEAQKEKAQKEETRKEQDAANSEPVDSNTVGEDASEASSDDTKAAGDNKPVKAKSRRRRKPQNSDTAPEEISAE